jgi:hypothetical protein
MNSSPHQGRRLRQPVAILSMISAGLALFSGCASEPESHVVSAPPPPAPQTQLVVAQPQPAQVIVANSAQTPAGMVIVMQAPPAVQVEAVQAQPSSDHKWLPGYWTWRDNR